MRYIEKCMISHQEQARELGSVREELKTLYEELQHLPPIKLETFYNDAASPAINPYGGIAILGEAYQRLHGFIQKFQSYSEEKIATLSEDSVEQIYDTLVTFKEARMGVAVEKVDRRAAEILAKDVFNRAKNLLDSGLLDDTIRGTIKFIHEKIRDLLVRGLLDEKTPDYGEDKFPLAYIMTRIKEIERFMELALRKTPVGRDEERRHTPIQVQEQQHTSKKKR